MDEYAGISIACMEGDIQLFEESIDANMQIFISSGVYLAVEKLRYLTLRNLMKKIAVAIAKKPEIQPPQFKEKPHLICLDIPLKILLEWDADLDIDEL